LPGATAAPRRAIVVAIVGCLGLVALETWGEHLLGITSEQSTMTWLFAVYSVTAAPVIEEIIFRGWLVFEGSGNTVRWVGAVAASILFAALHPFLWQIGDSGLTPNFTTKGWFSTAAVLGTSLWLYAVRLAPWNPQCSLLPCFAGHAAKNLGVVVVKAATGYMGSPW
jgi:uncharacterized protein